MSNIYHTADDSAMSSNDALDAKFKDQIDEGDEDCWYSSSGEGDDSFDDEEYGDAVRLKRERDQVERDMQRLREQLHTIGFNEALEFDPEKGDNVHMQNGFEEGFTRSMPQWFRAGQMGGIVDAIRTLSASRLDLVDNGDAQGMDTAQLDKYLESWRLQAQEEEEDGDYKKVLDKMEQAFQSSILGRQDVDHFACSVLQLDDGIKELDERMHERCAEFISGCSGNNETE